MDVVLGQEPVDYTGTWITRCGAIALIKGTRGNIVLDMQLASGNYLWTGRVTMPAGWDNEGNCLVMSTGMPGMQLHDLDLVEREREEGRKFSI